MTKELQIIKSFVDSDFHWVKIGTEQGWAKGDSCKRIFEGAICPRGRTWTWEEDDNKIVKKWDNAKDCEDWLPENILNDSFKEYEVDKTGKENDYLQLIKNIDTDVRLLVELHSGSISGVGYGKGWQVRMGLVYKNFIFKIYEYKTSGGEFELGSFYDIDYIRSIDFSDMDKLHTHLDIYTSEYSVIRSTKSTGTKDMTSVLGLSMDGDTLTISDKMMQNFSEGSSPRKCLFNQETLLALKPKKIILKENFELEKTFDMPDSLKEIVLDFKIKNWSEGVVEEFIDVNKTLSKYLNCSDDCEKISARELYNKELQDSEVQVNLWFEYKELNGFVSTNEYQLALLKKYYKDIKIVTMNVGDVSFEMPIKKFWDCIKIEKKIKNKRLFEKASSYFDGKVGYTVWFPKECDVEPKYKFEKKETA